MINKNSTLVTKIILSDITYYISDRSGIMLNGNLYVDAVVSFGGVEMHRPSIDGNPDVGKFQISLAIGETYQGKGYNFDIRKNWNNSTAITKVWTYGAADFDNLKPYCKGIIKNFVTSDDKITFDIDLADQRDTIELPGIVCEDQSALVNIECVFYINVLLTPFTITCEDAAHAAYFSKGEMVLLRNNDLLSENYEYEEYNVVDSISGANIIFRFVEEISSVFNYEKFSTGGVGANIIRKSFTIPPEDASGKTVPLQYGDLSDCTNGNFGKMLTTNTDPLYRNIMIDTIPLVQVLNICAWDDKLKRAYEARLDNINTNENEFTIRNNSTIDFRVDSTTTIKTKCLIIHDYIIPDDITAIKFINEDNLVTSERFNDRLSSINILIVDREQMLILTKPEVGDTEIWVERGYNDTEVVDHGAGTKISQSAKYSSKGYFKFLEFFYADTTTNIYMADYFNANKKNGINISGSFGNITDSDLTNYVEIELDAKDNYHYAGGTYKGYHDILFDMVFKEASIETTISRILNTSKINIDIDWPDVSNNPYPNSVYMFLYDPSTYSPYKGVVGETIKMYLHYIYCHMPLEDYSNGAYSLGYSPENYKKLFELIYNGANIQVNGSEISIGSEIPPAGGLKSNYVIKNKIGLGGTWVENTGYFISDVNDLNNKKMKLHFLVYTSPYDPASSSKTTIRIYSLSFLAEFFINFDKYNKTLIIPLKGRKITQNIIDICGNASGDLSGMLENPVNVLCHLLNYELGFEPTEFTSSWATQFGYSTNADNYEVSSPINPTPKCAFSYGIEDARKPGFEFVNWIASHFNFNVIKDNDGNLDIVNMHQIFNHNTTLIIGEIAIDDVLFLEESGSRRMAIKQTGTDLLFNDIIIKYSRNNSTDEYRGAYILPGSYILPSGNTLAQARTKYYSGNKKTKTIESPFIYNEYDAKRLAENIANEYAEIHLYVESYLSYYHYSDSNAMLRQCKIGDVVSITGSASGINFVSTKYFYITDIFYEDNAREVKLCVKSVKDVASF